MDNSLPLMNVKAPSSQTLLINYNQLLANTFLVDDLKEMGCEIRIHATKAGLCSEFLQNFIIAGRLEHCHVMVFLVTPDFPT